MKKSILTATCALMMLSGCSNSAEQKGGAPHVAAEVGATSDATFEQDVLKSNQPVLVDFFADWCGPCKIMSPLVDQAADQYGGKLKVFKVNVDESPKVAGALRIDAIPTLVIFKNGKIVTASQGAIGKKELTALIEKGLSGTATN